MSRIHFLSDNSKNDLFDDINSTKDISRDSISHSRQGWQYLVQRILNKDFSNELQILQFKLDLNIFQRYQLQLINKYEIKENERVYKIHVSSLLYLPSQAPVKSMLFRVGSLLHYSIVIAHTTHIMMIPSVARLDTVMGLSEIENQSEQEQRRSSVQKHITILPTNKDNGFMDLRSPKWRQSIDERYVSSYDPSRQMTSSLKRRSSDDIIRQRTMQAIYRNSYQDERLSSMNNLSSRTHHQSTIGEKFHDSNPHRLSVRSISYGFEFGNKIQARKSVPQGPIVPSPNYCLPANKIELDLNQQEIIRPSQSLKRKT